MRGVATSLAGTRTPVVSVKATRRSSLQKGSAFRYKSDGAGLNGHTTESTPTIYPYGEEGPPVEHNEVRRHYYPKNGDPKLKAKIKRRDVPKHKEWVNCYRAFRNGKPIGWQWKKPKDYRDKPYFGSVRDPQRMFWPEGEKDVDTLDRLGLPVFTFGGGDGLR
jgi:hypothetical protein